MGTCDRITGECQCIDGFEGAVCDRMSCPGASRTWGEGDDDGVDAGGGISAGFSCSGHGQCIVMSMLAEEALDDNGVGVDNTYGDTPNDPLTWDHDMVQGVSRAVTNDFRGDEREGSTFSSGTFVKGTGAVVNTSLGNPSQVEREVKEAILHSQL